MAEGLTCLIKVGAEADQNYQNYILRGIVSFSLSLCFVQIQTGAISMVMSTYSTGTIHMNTEINTQHI